MSHLLIEADDCLCVNQLLGHDQVESGDLIELMPSLLAIETSDLVIKTWQTDVRGVVQVGLRFAVARLASSKAISVPSVWSSSTWPIKQARQELLSITHLNDSLGQAIILIDEVYLLI